MTVKGKTSTGFAFEIDREALEDAEFLELYYKQEKDVKYFFDFVECALGSNQVRKLKDHVRNEKGRVPMEKYKVEVGEILAALAEDPETKN